MGSDIPEIGTGLNFPRYPRHSEHCFPFSFALILIHKTLNGACSMWRGYSVLPSGVSSGVTGVLTHPARMTQVPSGSCRKQMDDFNVRISGPSLGLRGI